MTHFHNKGENIYLSEVPQLQESKSFQDYRRDKAQSTFTERCEIKLNPLLPKSAALNYEAHQFCPTTIRL